MERDSIGQLLGQICRLTHMRMHSLLEDLGMYRGQPPVLRALWEQEGITHSELAQRLHVRPSTITNTIKRMEKAGFVERRADPTDQRVSRVYLTSTGREIRARVQAVWAEIDQELFTDLSEEEQALLCRLFVRVRENLLRASETHA